MEKIGIKGFPVSQNGQDFIIGKVKIQDLLRYTMYTERLIVGYDENEEPIYNAHIQRKADDSRTSKIADFLINDDAATFPTNIVLGIPANVIEKQVVAIDGTIDIVFKDCVAMEIENAKKGNTNSHVYITIIDGQHRIAGIEKAISRLEKWIADGEHIEIWTEKLTNLMNIELVISCFIDKSLEYEAMIFSTINRTQKRVSQDLVYSLFGITENDTPYKSALEVALALNGHPKSPFYKRIKLYGGVYDRSFMPPLSQSTMIKKIVSFISESLKEAENDRYRNRTELKKQKSKKFLPFRLYYANNQDKYMADCMFYFFSAVKKIFDEYWNYDAQNKPTNVLQSTVGFDALMDILRDIMKTDEFKNNGYVVFEDFLMKVSDIQLGDTMYYPMSTSGKKILYNTIFVKMFPHDESVSEKLREIEDTRNAG